MTLLPGCRKPEDMFSHDAAHNVIVARTFDDLYLEEQIRWEFDDI